MNKCIQKILLAACIVAMPVATHAGLIDHGTGYTRDSASNVVQGGGLEWLKWDETVGISINTALDTYAPLGWRLATNIEMAGLFNAFNFGLTYTPQEDVLQYIVTAWDGTLAGPHTNFIDLFGRTVFDDCPVAEGCKPIERAYAYFGDDADADALFNWAAVSDDYTYTQSTRTSRSPSFATLVDDVRSADSTDSQIAVALVRSVSVPEPSTFALLSLGLLGLGLNRRIHRKTL